MDLERVRWLLDHGADIHARNVGGSYPFLLVVETHAYLSARKAHQDAAFAVARLLLERSSEVSAPDGRGLTPLGYAMAYGKGEAKDRMLELILSGKPDLGITGPNGKTLLHILAAKPHPRALDVILGHLAD
jgi:ankyrin repeat protein